MNRRKILIALAALPLGGMKAVASPRTGNAYRTQWVLDPKPVITELSSPVGMAYDGRGSLYIANWSAGTIDRLSSTGRRETFAEDLNGPSGLAIAPGGDVYVASYTDNVVWRIGSNGKRSVFVKNLATPAGLGFEPDGRLLIANRRTNQILAATPDGKLDVVGAGLQTPVGAVRLANGELVVSNIDGGISVVDEGSKARVITTALRRPGPGIVRASHDAVFVVDYGGTTVQRVSLSGQTETIVDGLVSPVGLTISPQGDLMVATWGDNALYRIRSAPPHQNKAT